MSSKLDGNAVDHPKHYCQHFSGIEAIVFTEQLNFNLGNAFKYIYRHKEKWDPVEDVRKALWYLNREEFRLSQYIKQGYSTSHVKKEFLDAGLYSDEYKGGAQTARSKRGSFAFPLPINYGEIYIATEKDFSLSFDIVENQYLLGGLTKDQYLAAPPNPKQYIKILSSNSIKIIQL